MTSCNPLPSEPLRSCVCNQGSVVEQLLNPGIPDPQIQEHLAKADAMTRDLSGGRGYVWAAIGVDNHPCPMTCNFCSQSHRWQASTEPWMMSVEEVVTAAREMDDRGADFVVLRTTQCYGLERLTDLARTVRQHLRDDVKLVVNTGECTVEDVRRLREAGVNTAYHVVRLREGVDTPHSIAMRLKSIAAIKEGGLELNCLIEPLGPEHTAEEILTEARRMRELGTIGTGVMARVPVMGTPLAHLGQVGESYLRRVVAVSRFEYPDGGSRLCVHPPTPSALLSGANTLVVEHGAVPRASTVQKKSWRAFDVSSARDLLGSCGWQVRIVGESRPAGNL